MKVRIACCRNGMYYRRVVVVVDCGFTLQMSAQMILGVNRTIYSAFIACNSLQMSVHLILEVNRTIYSAFVTCNSLPMSVHRILEINRIII